MRPTRKVSVAGLAGAVTTVGFWVLGTYANVKPPAEVAAAVTFILMTVIGYLVPEAQQA